MKLLPRALLCLALLLTGLSLPAHFAAAQTSEATVAPQKVIIDTDIGDDIDDAFAVALALSSPRVQVLGITTAFGDTALRARLVERFLNETGHSSVPVYAGLPTLATNIFSQRRYAEQFPARAWPNGISFILDQIRNAPGQITLICIAPLSNVGALLNRDPATFRKLKRVVMMGGSIYRGYDDLGYLPDRGPSPEWNILMDIPAAKRLFASGVPIYMMPLDSTQLKLDEVMRDQLFSQGTRITDNLALLYQQWTNATSNLTPTLFDAMAVADVIDPSLCPVTPMHIDVDDKGFTRVTPGVPNAQVCLHSDSDAFFHFYFHTALKLHPEPLGRP
ncbi:MAG TPA: nucleoside hydrolase [Acidobacteriaceae bacterium]|nr:nucleoside hydrolase [Acidobacteriaceae bacterium]